MAIQILPAQLANQIAAGEVVERPASVVKELIENCLDAGATRIDIEIDKGGAKRILIRDNGSGIVKDELSLALSRHATSKIDNLDDLSAIATLGFRGEALASISSVSRLSLSSRTVEQEQAWQAQAAGRDMQVSLQPCAHPVGSSVEVLDLFFNTPARRKFLRTEKTEFSHIDELLKRLALSRFDVAVSLKHNGKLIRQYRISKELDKQLKRVSTVLGVPFTHHCLHLDNQHDQLRLHGWLGLPEVARAQNDQQYFYVNGRMMRDKLLQHAIRQAFAPYLGDDQHACYVLYLELPLDQVDVNVHPAKHEVRFHQARLVHDYIVQVLGSALSKIPQANQTAELDSHWTNETSDDDFSTPSVSHGYTATPAPRASSPTSVSTGGDNRHVYQSNLHRAEPPSVQELNANNQWLNTSASFTSNSASPAVKSAAESVLYPLHLDANGYLLARHQQQLVMIDVWASQQHLAFKQALEQWQQGLDSVPLLLPLKLNIEPDLLRLVKQQNDSLRRLGFSFNLVNKQQLIVAEVPKLFRKVDFALLIPSLLLAMSQLPDSEWQQPEALLSGLIKLQNKPNDFAWQQAVECCQGLQQIYADELPNTLWRPVDLSPCIAGFANE
ncbi:DNA mismatch repair endonuclease MutL [Agarivorans sp. 1_MG-2023]|uniref:DNA mismatch repair endonuclease MutL n=1 Tax=Agarivorans sp. 1_MG-2023 TaxID=3062634 RepID=UPI0026E27DD0|nr:DNA mismatch repair endonuclease MutL [Agarivorans sp. 1_MG-2023]MDO6766059.1 DNA mismatch repair endonuclease MutL [Agarivorans sp. 1_MG-2023]